MHYFLFRLLLLEVKLIAVLLCYNHRVIQLSQEFVKFFILDIWNEIYLNITIGVM